MLRISSCICLFFCFAQTGWSDSGLRDIQVIVKLDRPGLISSLTSTSDGPQHLLYVAANSDPEWNSKQEPLNFSGQTFDGSFQIPELAARLFVGVTANGRYYPVRRFDANSSGVAAPKIDYNVTSSTKIVDVFVESDPWRSFPRGSVKLTESNFEEFFAAVGLQLRLGFFGHYETYSRLHGDISYNRDFLFGSREAAIRIMSFADDSGGLPEDARSALANSLINLLKNGAIHYDPEQLPEAFGIYGKAVLRISENHDDETDVASWLKRLSEIYRDARKPGTCISLAQVLSGRASAAEGESLAKELHKFLHVMTECAQDYYTREYIPATNEMPAVRVNVAGGARFMAVREPQFVKSFLNIVDRMNALRPGSAGKEVNDFTYQYCQTGGVSNFVACQAAEVVGGGI